MLHQIYISYIRPIYIRTSNLIKVKLIFLLFASGTTIFGYGPILSSYFSRYCNTKEIVVALDSGERIAGIFPTSKLSCTLSSTSITNLSIMSYILDNTGFRGTIAKYQYDIYIYMD